MDRDELEDARDELLEDNEDDLEYHITFPSPTLNESTSASGIPQSKHGATAAAEGFKSGTILACASAFLMLIQAASTRAAAAPQCQTKSPHPTHKIFPSNNRIKLPALQCPAMKLESLEYFPK